VGFDTLLERARAGNEGAWADLYDSLAPQLLGYLRVRGAVDAEEVLGEVFLHVARGIHCFDGDMAGFRSWVFVIATSRLHDERRRRRRKPTVPLEPVAEELLTAGVDVQMEVEHASVAAEVQSLLCVLTSDQRAVVELRVFGGLTSQEVADTIGKPLGAVKALYRRGLRAMRRELEGDLAGAGRGLHGGARVLSFPAPAVSLRATAAVTRGS
jgi:RNA polymerase sigma-70 factor (ECF subfamily)